MFQKKSRIRIGHLYSLKKKIPPVLLSQTIWCVCLLCTNVLFSIEELRSSNDSCMVSGLCLLILSVTRTHRTLSLSLLWHWHSPTIWCLIIYTSVPSSVSVCACTLMLNLWIKCDFVFCAHLWNIHQGHLRTYLAEIQPNLLCALSHFKFFMGWSINSNGFSYLILERRVISREARHEQYLTHFLFRSVSDGV